MAFAIAKACLRVKLTRLALAGALLLPVSAVAPFGVSPALANDDDLPFEQRIIRSLLGGSSGAGIDYRERSPLVVPPSLELPAPAVSPVAGNPDWPQDPDQNRRPAASRGGFASDEFERSQNPLSQRELQRGRRAGASRQQGPAETLNENQMGIPLTPSQLGESRSLFNLMTRAVTPEKVEPFQGEPPRQRLTQPPAGYLTPSGQQPYAPPGQGRAVWKPTLPDPAAGAER